MSGTRVLWILAVLVTISSWWCIGAGKYEWALLLSAWGLVLFVASLVAVRR